MVSLGTLHRYPKQLDLHVGEGRHSDQDAFRMSGHTNRQQERC